MTKFTRRFVADESGATAIEYGLIAALVSIAGILSMQALGTSLVSLFDKVATVVNSAVGTSTPPAP